MRRFGMTGVFELVKQESTAMLRIKRDNAALLLDGAAPRGSGGLLASDSTMMQTARTMLAWMNAELARRV